MEFLVPIAMFVLIGWVVKTVSDNKIKKQALQSGNTAESLKHLWEKYYTNKPSQDIKFTVMFMGIGTVLLTTHILCLSEIVTVGLVTIVIGAAYLIHYIVNK